MEGDERESRFRRLYDTTRPQLTAYVLRRTASPEDAADVIGEVLGIAWRRLDDVPDNETGLLWLYTTARHVIASQRRDGVRRADLIARIGRELASVHQESQESDHEEAVMAKSALLGLSSGDRELLMLAGWEGLDSAQLGYVLGCSPTAARIRLHRARSRLLHGIGRLGREGASRPGDSPQRFPLRAEVGKEA